MLLRPTRRNFLASTAAATLAASASSAPARPKRKPNLLFIWTDEQRADTIDVYGNTRIQSPNLSKLAAESIVFENAYVSQPVCTPSRSTVLTGLWPHQNGCRQNNIALSYDVPAFPKLVDDPDYRSGYFGKWHLGDEIFAQHGFEEWRSIEDGYWRYYREDRDITKNSDYAAWLVSQGHTPTEDRGGFSRNYAASLPIEQCKPKFLELEACDFLRRHRDEPFILHVNFLEPHMPFTGPLNDLHGLDEVALPANHNDPLEENEPLSYRMRSEKYKGIYTGDLDLATEAGWRRLIANYWGLVSQVDRSVGAILATLEELGLAEDTIVVYTSDHGDMMGSHKLVEKGYMYEEAMRVPWLIRYPRFQRRHEVLKGRFSHIDLVPTLLDLMGAAVPDTLPGKSLVPRMKGARIADQPVFVEWNAPETMGEGRNPAGATRDATQTSGPHSRTIISPDGWKLTLNVGDSSQLFYLREDPGDTTNLIDRDEHRPVVQRLTAELRAWQDRTGDTLELPDLA
ncbi:MAG: sulfatase-like hydrolase/transferase [Candidatus Hydrogenedentes bacterium]|nr:sulfatase-like hydrolase/transferase [Candidatus Hydrogenedentota bacterium]